MLRSEVEQKSRGIAGQLMELKQFIEADCVMLYYAFDNEVSTAEIIKAALAAKKKVLLPRCDIKNRRMEACEVKKIDSDLMPSSYEIMEPVRRIPEFKQLEQIDICVVPGVAFDRQGNRIGHGAGFYDVFLARLSPRTLKVAIAFDLQLQESIPHNQHDVAMDLVITEKELLSFSRC